MKTLVELVEVILLLLLALPTLFQRYQALFIIPIPPSSTMRQSTSLALQIIMYNLRPIGRMIRCSLLTGNINKIDLYMASIKVHLYHFALYIGQKYLNVLKSTLYVKKLVVGQVIIFNKSVII